MTKYLTAYVVTAIVFLGIDLLWLTKVARNFYWGRLGELLLEKPNFGAAAAFYLLYVIGIVFFAITPALRDNSALTALIHGALFGLFAYGTYDMTNYATLKGWPIEVTLVDIAWGTFLTGLSAVLGYAGAQLLR